MSLNAFAFANVAASQTDSQIIAAATGRIILVKGIACLAGATTTNITFNSKGSGSGTAISMLFANAANGGFVLPPDEAGWFQTNSGEALTATTGSGSTTGVQVVYTIISSPGAN